MLVACSLPSLPQADPSQALDSTLAGMAGKVTEVKSSLALFLGKLEQEEMTWWVGAGEGRDGAARIQ